MTIPQSKQVRALPSLKGSPIVEPQTGLPTQTMRLWMQSVFAFIDATNRLIPANCSNSGNTYTLTLTAPQPVIAQYADYDVYQATASATSTGLVFAQVVTSRGPLGVIPVFKNNGSVQAGANDVQSGSLYFWIFNDALNSGNGGFVIK